MNNEKVLRWAINIAALVVLMDLSAVNIALPEMHAYFGYSVSFISLVLMISMLTATSSALILGKISQLASPNKTLILGFTTGLSFLGILFSFFFQKEKKLKALEFCFEKRKGTPTFNIQKIIIKSNPNEPFNSPFPKRYSTT